MRWLARWTDSLDRRRTLAFDSQDNLVIARVDFKLKLIDQHERIPNEFEVTEIVEQETVRLPIVRRVAR